MVTGNARAPARLSEMNYPFPGSPGQSLPSPSSIAKLSKAELYNMYSEATTTWKDERLRRRQNEIILDQVAPVPDDDDKKCCKTFA